jgi:hypothetical protein
MTLRERDIAGLEVYDARTKDGVLHWVASTSPPREVVLRVVGWDLEEGLMTVGEGHKLVAAGYTELSTRIPAVAATRDSVSVDAHVPGL